MNKTQDTIRSLAAEGYVGTDASLATSLFEYGLAWKKTTDEQTGKPELRFIYGIKVGTGEFGDPIYSRFDWAWFAMDTDVKKEFNWVHWDNFFSAMGQYDNQTEWFSMPLERKIADLVNYHGHEEIFSSSYSEGFEISE